MTEIEISVSLYRQFSLANNKRGWDPELFSWLVLREVTRLLAGCVFIQFDVSY